MQIEEIGKPLVSIIIITYNQENFISQCIDSIIKQVTDFPLEVIIGDDCSSDNTWQIIQDYMQHYPEIIKGNRSKNNLGLVKNYFQTINLCKGKYIAQCAGDDYWNDKFKIQKQVEFFECNQDYGMIHTDSDVLFESTGTIVKRYNLHNKWDIPSGNIFEDLLNKGVFIKSLSIMMRKKLVDRYLEEEDPFKWSLEDFPLFLYMAKFSKVHYFDYSTGVYRILNKSVTHQNSNNDRAKFLKGQFDLELYFAEKYGCSNETRESVLKKYNERKIEIGFYDLNRNISNEGLEFLRINNRLTIRSFLLYLGSRNIVFQFIIFRIFAIKKMKRIILREN